MSELRLAGNFINFTEILGSYGHLQIVFVDDDGTQLENEVQSAIPASIFGEWQYPNIREHTTNTSNYTADIGDKSKYTYVKLDLDDLGDRSAESVWEILLETREEFVSKGKDIDYDREKNSNSYVTSLLSVVGIDVNDVIAGATPTGVNEFPGVGVNVLNIEGDAFSLDLSGGAENDIFHTGIRNDVISPDFPLGLFKERKRA